MDKKNVANVNEKMVQFISNDPISMSFVTDVVHAGF